MGAEQELILIDTNIFVIDLRYKRDTNYKVNQAFLSSVAQNGNGFTTIVNLLELCGILTFYLNRGQLIDLVHNQLNKLINLFFPLRIFLKKLLNNFQIALEFKGTMDFFANFTAVFKRL